MRPSPPTAHDELRRVLAPLITLPSGGAGVSPASLEPIIAGLDNEVIGELLPFFRECCDSSGLTPPPMPGHADVQLTWPRRGQYCVQTASGDRFIHPDAGGVLRQELDHFLKDRYLTLDDPTNTQNGLTRIHTLRMAGLPLIELIARSQELQARLWLRKKLVLEAHYCFTLDLVPRELHPEIAANDAQRAEWVRLYHIDEIEPGYSEPLSVAFLDAHPYLMLDTRLFDQAFTDRLLGSFDDLDETLTGLLIHADNFHALTLLEPRYRNAIDCIYTDPPYNTGGADLPYPDRYARSHWLTLMENRFRIAHRLLKPGGPCFVSIDENEQARLELLLSEIFSPGDFVATFVWEAGRKNDSKLVSVSHEYMLCYVKDLDGPAGKGLTWRVRKEGIDDIYSKARSLVRQCKGDYRRASLKLRQWLNGLPDNHPARRHKHYHCIDAHGVYHPGNISWPGGGGPRYEVLHPVTGRPCKVPSRGWMYPTPQRMAEAIRDGLVHFGPDETRVPCAKVYLHTNEHHAPNSVFYRDGRAAMKRLRHILGKDCFCNPKDELLIADRIRFSCPRGAGVATGAGVPPASFPPLTKGGLRGGSWATGVSPASRGTGASPVVGGRASRPPSCGASVPSASKAASELAPSASEGSKPRGPSHPSLALRASSATPGLAGNGSPGARAVPADATILDFFAGSGSTAHAVLHLNRSDHGRRRYILVESGDAFDSILRTRIQRIVYSTKWKHGRPQAHDGISHAFKYLRLESYEDTLLNLNTPAADESAQSLPNVETFNYLLGLRVRRIRTDETSSMRWVEGTAPTGERVLVIWRKLTQNPKADEKNLTAWLERRRADGTQFDIIYANAANELKARRGANENWEIRRIEEHLNRLMWEDPKP